MRRADEIDSADDSAPDGAEPGGAGKQRTSRPTPPASLHLMGMVVQAMAAKSVHAAAELGLADVLAEQPLTSGELAERTGVDGPSLHRLLLALAGLGLVTPVDSERFALADLGQPLRTDAPDSVHGLISTMCGTEVWRSWGELTTGVRTGETAWELVYGLDWAEYYASNPESSRLFNLAMSENTRDLVPGILAAADLSRSRSVVDIGGGDGTLMAHVLREHPGLTGMVFDMPSGLETAATTLSAAGVLPRCRLVSGDFFRSVPADADAYLLKQVLHDWDDDESATILRNIRTVIPDDGRVFVLERVLPQQVTPGSRSDATSFLLDLHMMVVTGGQERTEHEYRRLLEAAGFKLNRAVAVARSDFHVIEAVPA
ncbi:methyltransferase [Streptomyces sp. YKOK-I1]